MYSSIYCVYSAYSSFCRNINLLDYVWADRYKLRFEKVYDLPLKYSGESFESKLGRVREYMKSEGADGYVLSSLCDIAWLLN